MIAFALLLPLVLAALLLVPGVVRRVALDMAPWSAAPAVLLALSAPQGLRLELPWLLLGSTFGLDQTGKVFLLLTGLLWLVAGLYARGYLAYGSDRLRFFAYHLITLAGNLGVVLAHDTVSFYLSFVVMTLAAFGLIVHEGTAEAKHGGLVYLVMAIIGEGLLLFGFVLAANRVGGVELPQLAGAEVGPLAAWLLLLGFGVKAGLPLLHMWLPLAHPVAPTPASAVLSGAMIKAGLLGWIRFLPLGGEADPLLGTTVIVAGSFAAFYGAVLGVSQRQPKALLAYSSVSQMGFMTLALGASLLLPEIAPAAHHALLLFAFHHALTKGALFLATGIEPLHPLGRIALLSGVALAAAALAGLPFTSGALAKSLLKEALHPLAEHLSWANALPALVSLAAAGTALLMLRLLWLLAAANRQGESRARGKARMGLWLPWLTTLLLVAGAPLLLALQLDLTPYGYAGLDLAKVWELLWPSLLAAALLCILLRSGVPHLPPGDLLLPLERAYGVFQHRLRNAWTNAQQWRDDLQELWNAQRQHLEGWQWLRALEGNLMRWDSAGTLLLVLGALLAVSLWRASGG